MSFNELLGYNIHFSGEYNNMLKFEPNGVLKTVRINDNKISIPKVNPVISQGANTQLAIFPYRCVEPINIQLFL